METRHPQKYNQAYTLNFNLYQVNGVDMEPAATFAAGDIVIMKDEGAEANTTNLPTDEGTGYSLVLTATEMSAARIVIYIIDQTATKVWLDIAIAIETYGHASAQHAFDLDTASSAQTGDSFARLGAPAGASVSADIAVIEGQTDDIGVAGAGLIDLGGMSTGMQAEVNAEVLDVLNVDTFTEPSGVPAATATLAIKIGYLYMALRNKITVTSTKKTFFDDSDAAEWEKDLTDDGSIFTESEGNAI